MIFQKVRKNKKGNWILPVTAFYILFNVCLFVMLLAFSQDPQMTGEIGDTSNLDINESLQEGEFSVLTMKEDIEAYQVEVNQDGMPFWFKIIFFGFEFVLGLIIIIGWVRGV